MALDPLQDKNFLIYSIPPLLTHGFDTGGTGEGIWGLNIAKCLTDHGCEVYTSPGVQWLAPTPPPPNFHPGTLPQDKIIFFAYFSPNMVGIMPKVEKCIACKFDGMSLGERCFKIPENWIIVHSYPAGTRHHGLTVLGKHFAFLPHIVDIPDDNVDRFHNTNIFWTGKGSFKPGSQPPDLPIALMEWVGRVLKDRPEMTFSMVSFWEGKTSEQAQEFTKSHPLARGLVSTYPERVKIYGHLDYGSVKKEIARSKIILNPGNFWHTYGGSTIEAAFYGIPTIQYDEGPFIQCSEKIVLPVEHNTQSYLTTLNLLMSNGDFYRQKGDAYKAYARTTYSSQNFLNILKALV